MAELLKLEGVESSYGASQVLFGMSLEIREGEVVTLLGRNGMGKTTTVRTIMGIVRAQTGQISYSGQAIHEQQSFRIAKLGLGLVPEGRQIFPNLTVHENLVATAANRTGTICSRRWPNAKAIWAISYRAASSKCWPLAGR
jgi:branched-chain amino acid transport system ATP-binding protein